MKKILLAIIAILAMSISMQMLNISKAAAVDVYVGTAPNLENQQLCYIFISTETIKQSSYTYAKNNLVGKTINVDTKYVQNGKLLKKVKYHFDKLGNYFWEYKSDVHAYMSPVYVNTYQYNMLKECSKILGITTQVQTTRGMQLIY